MILLSALMLMAALAGAAPALTRWLGRNAGYPLTAGFLLVGGLIAAELPVVAAGGSVAVSWRWLPALDVSMALRLDGLAMVFALLVLGVGALVMAYCPRYLAAEGRHTGTYTLLTLFAAAMLGLVFAADLLVLFLCWELTTICSYFLIAGGGRAAGRAANRALIVTAAGGLALLSAVVLLAVTLGTSDLAAILAQPQVLRDTPAAWAVGALLIVAAFTKSAQFPFHFWLPTAMVAITPVSAYLHAATMVKAGIYLLMRFTPLFAGQPAWTYTLVLGGLVTAVLGAFLALRQHDLKAVLAYSTVSQLGLLVAAVGVGTAAALTAAILHTVAHALFKATLFMLVGIIDREAGSRDIRQLGGLRRAMPVTAVLTGLAAASMAGLPPLVGFVSKEALFDALLDVPGGSWLVPVAALLAVTASALTFGYGMRILHGAFAGGEPQPGLYEPAATFLAPAAAAALLGAALGPAVGLLDPLVASATYDTRTRGSPPGLTFWHGFTPALAMSAAAIGAGLALFLARDRVEPLVQGAPLPPPGGRTYDRAYDALLRFGAAVGRFPQAAGPAGFLGPVVVTVTAVGAAAVVAAGGLPAPPAAASRAADWAVLLLLTVGLAGLVLARSALAVVALLGLNGLVVAAWFVLAGGPDVALTLVLVEVLTAAVAMLVLRRMPGRLPRPRRAPAAGGAALAAAAGLVAAAGTLHLTGRPELSLAGGYFLRTAQEATGGSNVVNTILVDFRALDTLGEATVLAAVALGLLALLGDGPRGPRGPRPPAAGPAPEDAVLWLAQRLLSPVMLIVSGYLFVRGHDEPGGGFIAALVAGIAVGLAHLADHHDPVTRRLSVRPLLAAGLALALASGLAAIAVGRPLLTPLTIPLPTGDLSTALVFDLGIYLIVLALVVAAVQRLGAGPDRAEVRR